jgi:CRP-like cAMP-binding protein
MASPPREVWGDLAATAFVETSLLFRSLDDAARRDLVRLARVVDFAAGEVVSAEDDDGFWLVRDGVAAVRVHAPDGAAFDVAQAERGAIFGAARVLSDGRPWSLVARTAVSAIVVPAPVVGALAERFPKMRKLLEAVVAARARDAAQRAPG